MSALDRPFSYSQISSYLRCPKAWEYSYKEGLVAVHTSRALRIGSLVDTGIEGALKGREIGGQCKTYSETAIEDAYDEWFKSEPVQRVMNLSPGFAEESRQTKADAISIAARGIKSLQLDSGRYETIRDSNGKLAVQYEVRHPLAAHKHGFIGFLDWCPLDTETGDRWILDLKCRASLQKDEALAFDYQLAAYEFVAQDKFEAFTGVGHWQLKSKVPTPPALTKRGMLTKARTQSCDWETYLWNVRSYGFDENDYLDMKDKLPKFESWTWHMRGQVELENTWSIIEEAARRLVVEHTFSNPQLRVLNPHVCGTCDYAQLCMAELRGQDSEFIRESAFKKRDP